MAGAAANALGEHVPPAVQQERYERFMEHAQAISAQRLQRRIGTTIQVLVDDIDGRTAIARSAADAPEIDGLVRISNGGKLKVGEFAQVKVTGADAYDLKARVPATPRQPATLRG